MAWAPYAPASGDGIFSDGTVTNRFWPQDWDPRRVVLTTVLGCGSQRRGMVLTALWRTVVSLYIATTIFRSWAITTQPGIFAAYFTHWGVFTSLTFFITAALAGWATLYNYTHAVTFEQLQRGHIGRLCRAATVLMGMATTMEIIIVTVYWTLLYKAKDQMTTQQTWINSTVHAVTLCCLLLDLLMGANRNLDFHFLFLCCLMFVYLFVNLAVSLAVQPVYPILTWKNAETAMFLVGCLVALPLCFSLVACIAWLRDRWFVKRWGSGSTELFASAAEGSDAYNLLSSSGVGVAARSAGAGRTSRPPLTDDGWRPGEDLALMGPCLPFWRRFCCAWCCTSRPRRAKGSSAGAPGAAADWAAGSSVALSASRGPLVGAAGGGGSVAGLASGYAYSGLAQ